MAIPNISRHLKVLSVFSPAQWRRHLPRTVARPNNHNLQNQVQGITSYRTSRGQWCEDSDVPHISSIGKERNCANGTFLVQCLQYFYTIPVVNRHVVQTSTQTCLSLPSMCGTKHGHWDNPATRNDVLAAWGATSPCCQVSTGVVRTACFPSHATGLYSATLIVRAVARAAYRVISTSATSALWFC